MKFLKKDINPRKFIAVSGKSKKSDSNLKTRTGKKNEEQPSLKCKGRPGKLASVNDFSSVSVDDFMRGNLLDSPDSETENDYSENKSSVTPKPTGKATGVFKSKRQSKRERATKASSFIDFEADEEEPELDNSDSFINDNSESEEEDSMCGNVNTFIDDEAVEDNTFDYGGDDVESGDEDNEASTNSDLLDDGSSSVDDNKGNWEGDKDYADIPGAADNNDENEDDFDLSAHKKSLERLRSTDPEFYKYLEENDKKLLQFNDSDSEDEDADNKEKFHKPTDGDLEVASDESDFEGDEETDGRVMKGVVTLKMVRAWQEELQTSKAIEPIATAVQVFHAALIRVTGTEESCQYKVDGSAVFNAVVQMCVLELQPAIKRFLRLPSGSGSSSAEKILPQKCKKWKKVKSHLKSYLQDLHKLMTGVSSPHVVATLLKHLHQMVPFLAAFPILTQRALKRLTSVWGSGEETSRVLAFLCIVRICTNQRSLLDSILKQMYLAYVSNVKFVSPNNLANINFMRRSLVEVYRLDEAASYQHVFLYIRQLAIHLRNATTLQRKEAMQSVLNWQFVHSVHLWAELLGATANKTALQPLLYPLVQVTIGTIKLIPTTQYFPLRFHCVEILINLSKNTNTFIPVLPFLLEVLSTYDFNKKPKKASMKPMDMTCMLRVSKTEQTEKNFKDTTIEQVHRLLLLCLANEAHSIAFPDLVMAPTLQIKKFLKDCKVANYCKKIKAILDKVEENVRFVENERKKTTLTLNDRKAVDAFETNLKLKGTPLATYCANFQKVNAQVMKKRATDSDAIGDYGLPLLVKRKRKVEDAGPADPFPSGSDSDDNIKFGFESEEEIKVKQKKRTKKSRKVKPAKIQSTAMMNDTTDHNDQPDIVKDLRLEDI